MAKQFQNVAHISRTQFEEVSCTKSLNNKRTYQKAQFQGIMRHMQINHKEVSAHTSQNNHQQKKLQTVNAEGVVEKCTPSTLSRM